jgi:DNA-binding Lrp family transcriptional regulator
VDPLDFAIFRSLSPGGEARFWAGRRVIDPRIPAREIAEQVGVSENGVRTRLQGLARQGYLRGSAVIPNPSLFGVQVFVTELPVREPSEVNQLYRDLSLVERVVFARDTLDEGERRVQVHLVAENDAAAVRQAALLRRLSPQGKVSPPRPYWIPPCELELTPLDWRVLRAASEHPDATLAETALSVGIGLKTVARRYHQLIDGRACWWTHGPDSEEFPLALLRLDLDSPAERESVTQQIHENGIAWMPVARDGHGAEPETEAATLAGLVPADSPTVLERVVGKLASLPGVVRVHRTFALGSTSYSGWWADQIGAHIPALPERASRRSAPSRARH